MRNLAFKVEEGLRMQLLHEAQRLNVKPSELLRRLVRGYLATQQPAAPQGVQR